MQHVLNSLVTALLTAALGYLGLVQPNTGSRDAQNVCCPIARECVAKLP
jgi:hypothetical protein